MPVEFHGFAYDRDHIGKTPAYAGMQLSKRNYDNI
jgi:hypothetical protein